MTNRTIYCRLGLVAFMLLCGCERGEVRQAPQIPAPESASLAQEDTARLLQSRAQVEEHINSADAWGRYGMLLHALEFHSEAVASYRRAHELDPAEPRWPYFISRLIVTDDPAASLSMLRTAVERCGSDPEAPRYYLAKALAESGDWQEAERHAAELLRANPEFTPARLIQAQAANARGDYASTKTLAEKCLSDARTAKAARALLAAVLARQGNAAEAEQTAKEGAALPIDELVYDAFEAQVGALRRDPRPLAVQAHSLLAARKLGEAEHLISRLVNDYPNFSEGWLALGRLRLLEGKLPAAEASLRKHLSFEPNSIQGWFQLGMAQLNAQQYQLAADTFKRATELKADFGPAWFNRGYALGRARRFEEATEAFRDAIRYHPEHLQSYLLLADLELQLGRRQEALGLLERAEAIAPSDRGVQALRRKLLGPSRQP